MEALVFFLVQTEHLAQMDSANVVVNNVKHAHRLVRVYHVQGLYF
jgi:hypothetical protein